jgi:hypothetical protein
MVAGRRESVADKREQPHGPGKEGTGVKQGGRNYDGTSEASVHGYWVIQGKT